MTAPRREPPCRQRVESDAFPCRDGATARREPARRRRRSGIRKAIMESFPRRSPSRPAAACRPSAGDARRDAPRADRPDSPAMTPPGQPLRTANPDDQKSLHQDLRLPDERVRLGQDGRRAQCRRRPREDRHARRRGRHPVQHLLGAREGAGEGVLRPRPRARTEGSEPEPGDRRGRLRGQPGRRGDRRARALRGRGVRPADPAPPAADDRRAPRQRPPAGRHQLPRDREVRPPAAGARRGPERLRVDHGRLQQVLQLLRGALHARRRGLAPARRRAHRSRRPRRPGRARGHPAGPERQRLSRRADPGLGGNRRLRHADRIRGRDPRHRAHPLHHLASEGIHPAPDRRLRAGAQAGEPPAPAGAARLRPHPDGDEARLHRARIQVGDPQAARDPPRSARCRPTSSSASPARPRTISRRP